MTWTPERVKTLRRMAEEGASAQKIAVAIGGGITVISKSNRDGIKLKPNPGGSAQHKKDAAVEREKLRMMRGALTRSTYSHGIGGLPRRFSTTDDKKPISLAKLNIPDMVD